MIAITACPVGHGIAYAKWFLGSNTFAYYFNDPFDFIR
jgi:hypothetical protein